MIPLTQMPGALDLRGATLTEMDRALSADRYGKVRAVIVSTRSAEAAQAILDRCWHEAAVITADATFGASRAA